MIICTIFNFFRSTNHLTMMCNPSVSYPFWCRTLYFLMLTTSTTCYFAKHKNVNKNALLMLLYLAFCSTCSNKKITFLQKSDELNLPSHFRSPSASTLLLNAVRSSNGSDIAFDTTNFPTKSWSEVN